MKSTPSADNSNRIWRELEALRALAQESRETLIRLETRLADLTRHLEELHNGTTMPRCTAHASRIDHLEDSLQSLCTKIWRFASVLAVSMTMLGITRLWEIMTQ